MTEQEFREQLRSEGFDQLVLVERAPAGMLDRHRHPFEAKALVLQGSIEIDCAGERRTYAAGEVFHLPREAEHVERYGPQGVRYLVGRR